MSSRAQEAPAKDGELWTLRSLVVQHKPAALLTAAVITVLLVTVLIAAFASTSGLAGDSTTCTAWGAANQDQQAAYARLYLREHGALPKGGSSPADVLATINHGCTLAYDEGVSDSTNVIQAISGRF